VLPFIVHVHLTVQLLADRVTARLRSERGQTSAEYALVCAAAAAVALLILLWAKNTDLIKKLFDALMKNIIEKAK
jgi:Flp pilus assembly pilin Flp